MVHGLPLSRQAGTQASTGLRPMRLRTEMVRVWERDVAYVGEVVSLQCALDPYDVGVTILYAEGAINERLASFDWELVDV